MAAVAPAARRRAIVIAGHRADVAAARVGLLDEDPAVRASALAALQRAGHLRSDELSAAMRDGSPVVRRRAAEIAAHHVDASLVPLLDDTDPSVVEIAAWASGVPPASGLRQGKRKNTPLSRTSAAQTP